VLTNPSAFICRLAISRLGRMSDDATRFRKQAEEARDYASRVHGPLDREAWLRVAEEWIKLAESAEARRRYLI
jgi:hypothetical protein